MTFLIANHLLRQTYAQYFKESTVYLEFFQNLIGLPSKIPLVEIFKPTYLI